MQVPRVVEKKTPYTYTVRMPRTVVTKVPLDSCGNPIPTAPAAAIPAAAGAPSLPMATAASYETVPTPPAASARPTTPPAAPAASGPLKTFSDKPAEMSPPVTDGWKASTLDHADPAPTAAETRQADKPIVEAVPGRSNESMPAPAAAAPSTAIPTEQAPTIAPPGPLVEPAAPTHDLRDVPAAARTSGTGFLRVIPSDHTT